MTGAPLTRRQKSEAVYEDGVIFSPRKNFKNKEERMCTYEMYWHMYARQRRMECDLYVEGPDKCAS